MKQHTLSTITALLLYCLPMPLVAQHGSGGAGMGEGLAIFITVVAVVGTTLGIIVLINIIACFKPKKVFNTIGISLSILLMVASIFMMFSTVISGNIDVALSCAFTCFFLLLSIIHLRHSNQKIVASISSTEEHLLDDDFTT